MHNQIFNQLFTESHFILKLNVEDKFSANLVCYDLSNRAQLWQGRNGNRSFKAELTPRENPFITGTAEPFATQAQEAGLEGHKCYLSTRDLIHFWMIFVSTATRGWWPW